MKNYLSKHILLTISIISFILLLIPIVIFLCYFGGKTVSNDLSVWASFGDFIGGTLNIILSLSSLVILGLLTHNIGKQSSEENKNINFLIRRMDSYDLLSKYLTDIELANITGRIYLDKAKEAKAYEEKLNILNNLQEKFVVHYELYALLTSFRSRFSQLYSYDFDSQRYRHLVETSRKVKENLMIIHNDDREFDGDFLEQYEEFFELFNELLENLKKELQ